MIFAQSNKIIDSDSQVSDRGRADQYWSLHGFRHFFAEVNPKMPVNWLNKRHIDNIDLFVLKKFKWKALEFGNWLSSEDCFNYAAALFMASYDLNRVLRFHYNLGLDNRISVAFGARGHGRAMAHYEPNRSIINITRYHDGMSWARRPSAFITSGGMNAFAHEYGHALDYIFGAFFDRSTKEFSLTGGRKLSIIRENPEQAGSMRYWAKEVIRRWQLTEKGDYTESFKRLRESFTGDYQFRHNEIFARSFEQWVGHRLDEMGIHNKLLTQRKYKSKNYLLPRDEARVFAAMSKLVELMRKEVVA